MVTESINNIFPKRISGGIKIRKESKEAKERQEKTDAAKGYLNIAIRDAGIRNVELPVAFVVEITKEAGIGLKEIGTSLENLSNLQKKGYFSQARKLLKALREAKSNNEMKYTHSWDTEHIYAYLLSRLGLGYEAIGTTREEIMDFEREALLAGIKDHLKEARSMVDFEPISSSINFILNVSSKGNISLEEAGTSFKEIEELQRMSIKD